MAKKEFERKEEKKMPEEMTLEEARAYRVSKYKPAAVVLSEQEKREQFRIFWARERSSYGKPKNLEQILWVHLKASKLDDPSKFDDGIKHFGLKKLGN